MDIKQLAESILQEQQENQAIITEIFKTGSSVFNLNRNTDKDYVVICKNFGQRKRRSIVTVEGIKYDILFFDELAYKASLDFNNTSYVNNDTKIFNYFSDDKLRPETIIYGDSKIRWSMLEHKKEYLEFIRNRFQSSRYNILKDPWKIGKTLVHYYIILKMYEDNKVELTDEILHNIELFYNLSPQCAPFIDWIKSKLLDSPEPYVVEGIPPIPQEDAGVVTPPVPITESSEQ
jgi:hypothetical protein